MKQPAHAVTRCVTINAVCIAASVPFGPNGEPSAVRKVPVSGPIEVTALGLGGDAHGDTVHHGGAEKAVHHYAFEHYGSWSRCFPEASDHFQAPAFFGENISTTGVTEETICIGDVFRAGTTLLQVSEVRQPCWKLSHRCGVPGFSRRVQETGRTGWFYRVLEPGVIAAGDSMVLDARPRPDWPLARLLTLLYHAPLDQDELSAIAEVVELSAGQRAIAERRLATGEVEPWDRRLDGPLTPSGS
jgi:MOSC domain-containing protein YiiM